MVNIPSSSLIGAQAYAAQLRRQYGEEETARAFSLDDRPAPRSGRQIRRDETELDQAKDKAQRTAAPPADGAKSRPDVAVSQIAGNPTVGEIAPRQNPPARPLFSSAKREAPNPNAQLRNVRPGTHLDITI